MALSALLAFGFAAIPVSAELPMEFWENNNRLIAALEQMDADSAVTLCNLVVGALEAEPESAVMWRWPLRSCCKRRSF